MPARASSLRVTAGPRLDTARRGFVFWLDEGHAKRRQLHCPGGAESFMEPPGSASMALDGMTWAAL